MRVLGVIPARGGSKRVHRKNLRELKGKPLIAYTIEACQKATKLTDWVLSTDDAEISKVAEKLGATVIIRPERLSEDHISSGAVLRHALDVMERDTGSPYQMVLCLHPTSPIRDPRHIDEAIERLERSTLSTLASVCRLPHKKHDNIKHIAKDGSLVTAVRSQGYILNASIYAMKRDWFVQGYNHTAAVSEPLVMDRAHSMDIDDEIDLQIAELFLDGLSRTHS